MKIINLRNTNVKNVNALYMYYGTADENGIPLIMRVAEGTGDNLLREDIAEGYVDYITIDLFRINEDADPEGGMLLTKKLIREYPNGLYDLIPDAMEEMGVTASTVYLL